MTPKGITTFGLATDPALALGALVMLLAALLAGATGFGFALVSMPLLLALGFPLKFIVTANLSLALVTRISVAWQLRRHLFVRQAALLILGSVPGLYLGVRVVDVVNGPALKVATGALVMLTAVVLLRSAQTARPIPGGTVAAGLAGGFLGATMSLNGVPPALLLTRNRARPLSFLADLAVYFVVSNAIALVLLQARGDLVRLALVPAAAVWLPGALVGNWMGVRLAGRIPEATFRSIALLVIFISGALAAAQGVGALFAS
ncbi:MAG TPA: sulfite exporter TauE/SafE family protein [Thermomicrobiaceae bacterium]|nr:sulfite exporter TauE/SafE family protein [Thermomicrobiaceae bacterium]